MDYNYEGSAKVKCRRCGILHEVFFSGSDACHPEEALNVALEEDMWDSARTICPECLEDQKERGIEDELEDEEIWDEISEYEEEWEEELT